MVKIIIYINITIELFITMRSLKYQNSKWNIDLPTIRAYTFDKKEIDSFIEKGEYPLDFDINLRGGCNANCVYCATKGGQDDVRFDFDRRLRPITDRDISEMIRQLSKIGTKTFFLCGNGEPLLSPQRFLDVIDSAGETDMNIITYTNGTTLTRPVLKELHKRQINLVMKLESLDPKLNDSIISGKSPTKNFSGYRYGTLHGNTIPVGIIEAFEVYGADSDCLGLETMILRDNFQQIAEMRDWVHNKLGVTQFLKHLYALGYAEMRGENVLPDKDQEEQIKKEILDFDRKQGFVYPEFAVPDVYSYDARRFMNNCVSVNGFPMRMFTHERGGIYHSSKAVPVSFGFGTENIVSIFNSQQEIDLQSYFQKIQETLNGTKPA